MNSLLVKNVLSELQIHIFKIHLLSKWVFDCYIDAVDYKLERVAGLINATTPVKKETGHLKLIAAFKFIAILGTKDVNASASATPHYYKHFEGKIQEFLSDIMNDKFQINSYVEKIS